MATEPLVEIEVEKLVHQTDKGWLLQIDNEHIWFPKSRIEYTEGDNVAYIPFSMAKEKGLNY